MTTLTRALIAAIDEPTPQIEYIGKLPGHPDVAAAIRAIEAHCYSLTGIGGTPVGGAVATVSPSAADWVDPGDARNGAQYQSEFRLSTTAEMCARFIFVNALDFEAVQWANAIARQSPLYCKVVLSDGLSFRVRVANSTPSAQQMFLYSVTW